MAKIQQRVTSPGHSDEGCGDASITTSGAAQLDPDKIFSTAHLSADLRGRSIRGATVTVGAQAARFGLQIISTMILARLLAPADFGLIAMVNPIVGFIAVFADAGLSRATMQQERVTHGQVSTLFWVNVALGAVLVIVIVAIAPLVAWFYDERSLVGVTSMLALPLFFSAISVQHSALLIRQMRFTVQVAITLSGQAVSIGVGIIAAGLGAEYWSLVYMTIVSSLWMTLATWIVVRWVPGRPQYDAGVRSMLAFGGNLTAFSFINYMVRNLDNVLVGWAWGKISLGLYSKAYGLLLLPIAQVTAPVGNVAVTALCRLQNDPDRFRNYYRKGLHLLVSLSMPIVAFCTVAAHDIIFLLLGPKWMGIVPIFRALAPAAFLGTFNVAAGWIFVPLGQADRQLRVGFVTAVVVVVAFFIGLPWGPLGVAYAYSTASALLRLPCLLYAFAKAPVKMRDLGWAIWLPAAASAIAASGAWMFQSSFDSAHWFSRPLFSFGIFSFIYIAGFVALSRLSGRELQLFQVWKEGKA